jgi:hypothetical protein
MSHSITSLTNITLTMLNIYSSLITVQQNMPCVPCRQMQHHGYYGSTSLISSIMGTNEITFNINLQTIIPHKHFKSLLWKYQFSDNAKRDTIFFTRHLCQGIQTKNPFDKILSSNFNFGPLKTNTYCIKLNQFCKGLSKGLI